MPLIKRGRVVLGQCEEVMPAPVAGRNPAWSSRCMNGSVVYRSSSSPRCRLPRAMQTIWSSALVGMSFYHIAQATDDWRRAEVQQRDRDAGSRFAAMTSRSSLEWYGVTAQNKDVQEMVDAANRPAEVAHIDVARACGTYAEVGINSGLVRTDGELWRH